MEKIERGSELTITYLLNFLRTFEERSKWIERVWKFKCACVICSDEKMRTLYDTFVDSVLGIMRWSELGPAHCLDDKGVRVERYGWLTRLADKMNVPGTHCIRREVIVNNVVRYDARRYFTRIKKRWKLDVGKCHSRGEKYFPEDMASRF
jgi:hypothetical protein